MALLGHKVVLFFIFRGNSTLFFVVAAPVTVSPAGQEGSLVSTSSATLVCCFIADRLLRGVRCPLTVVIICVSLMISDVEHLVASVLVIRTYSLECLLRSTVHFVIGLFGFVVLSCMDSS